MNHPLMKKIISTIKKILIKLITFMVRQAHYERNQYITVRPVEGLDQSFLKASQLGRAGNQRG